MTLRTYTLLSALLCAPAAFAGGDDTGAADDSATADDSTTTDDSATADDSATTDDSTSTDDTGADGSSEDGQGAADLAGDKGGCGFGESSAAGVLLMLGVGASLRRTRRPEG
ncbi:MAG: hypothetical protein H6741_05560 [Alphaproteobacteria bacterium]|nr:hypothetical protein [Alphaproteobacteria bacterium]MCB9792174.1 hypothetical protein [Alphaproteobacteria bacterium]